MLVQINPIEVDGITYDTVNVRLSLSSSLNLSAVPVDKDGADVDGHALAIVLGPNDPALASLIDAVAQVFGPAVQSKIDTDKGFTAIEVPEVVEPPAPPTKDELHAQALEAMLAATAALDAAKERYDDAAEAIEVGEIEAPVDVKG